MNMQKISSNEPSNTFADRIKVLIQRVGSVTEIARMCGFSEGVVRSWRDGNTDPSRARCVTLAKTLGISLVWLVAGEGTIQADAIASGEELPNAEASANRHRSKLRTAADTLHASGMAMDPQRLNTALRILQSELDLAESRLTLADNADMLADLYEILGPGGADVDASEMVSFNQRLHERVKRGRQAVA